MRDLLLEADPGILAAWASPAAFAHLDSRGRFKTARHTEYLCEKLQRVASGEIKRLMVFMPPRHTKSTYCSQYFPAWFLGRNPDSNVILTSYEADFAAQWGQAARDLLRQWGPTIFGISVNPYANSRSRWDLWGHRGGMKAVGVGGAITGKGADLLVIDDPVKDYEAALSPTMRKKAWQWWLSTARTRLEPEARAVLIMTRWHQEDLAGKLLEHEGDEWEVLSFPALAKEDDPLGREPGEALWPERWPREALEKLRDSYDHDEARLGPYWWSALYQQEPQPESGALFQRSWFRYFRKQELDGELFYNLDRGEAAIKASRCWRFQSVDLAVSEKETADYTAISTWDVGPGGEQLLVDCSRARLAFPDQCKTIERIYAQWKPHFVRVESNAYQLSMVQALRQRNIPVVPYTPKGDKVARAQSFAARLESGKAFFREDLPELGDLEAELLAFPQGKHDDFVDTCSMAANDIIRHGQLRAS